VAYGVALPLDNSFTVNSLSGYFNNNSITFLLFVILWIILFFIFKTFQEKTFEILRKHQKEFSNFIEAISLEDMTQKPLLKELQQVMVV
jgi:predicted negative regulator of RcsB-dependent stress response